MKGSHQVPRTLSHLRVPCRLLLCPKDAPGTLDLFAQGQPGWASLEVRFQSCVFGLHCGRERLELWHGLAE